MLLLHNTIRPSNAGSSNKIWQMTNEGCKQVSYSFWFSCDSRLPPCWWSFWHSTFRCSVLFLTCRKFLSTFHSTEPFTLGVKLFFVTTVSTKFTECWKKNVTTWAANQSWNIMSVQGYGEMYAMRKTANPHSPQWYFIWK